MLAMSACLMTVGCGSSAATAPGSGPAEAVPSKTTRSIGLDLVRAAADLDLRPAVGISDESAQAPEGSLLVRFAHDGVSGEQLVVPVAPGGPVVAWITDEDAALLAPEAAQCPEGALSVPVLQRLGPSAILCFDGGPFEFGVLLPGFCGVADEPLISGQPDWLTGSAPGVVLYGERVRPEDAAEEPTSGSVWARLAPGASFTNCDADAAGQFHLITAHFDDPASIDCRTQWSDGGRIINEEPAVSVARCRLTMVITGTTPLPGR